MHTRPFVTPLGTETPDVVRLVGTGSYVRRKGRRSLLTCEHVARYPPMHYRFCGSDNVFEHRGPWIMEGEPVDAAFAPISDTAWQSCPHQAIAISYTRFAARHQIVQQAELLFFRGYSGENAHYAFGVHQTNGSGYCSQEKQKTGDNKIFEMFWDPDRTEVTSGTEVEARAETKFEDPSRFSGLLVWNTRYIEVTSQGRQWTPECAVVTGLLQRWDPATTTLLVWRVEHLRAWLERRGF